MRLLRTLAPRALPPLTMSDPIPSPDGHLTTNDVSAYLGTRMHDSDRRRLEAHLADCDECRAELLEVRSMLRTAPPRSRSRRPLPGVLGAAAAAAILISVQWRVSPRADPDADTALVTERAVLSDVRRDSVEVVAPQADANVTKNALNVAWRRGADDTQFTVTLMNARGDVLWTTRTRDSTVVVPDSVSLAPGAAYVVYVDALRADGTSARSGPRSFSVTR